jgi:hypothetical protein
LRGNCGVECCLGVLGLAVGDLDQRLLGRGVVHGEPAAATRVTPLTADEQPAGEPVEDGTALVWGGG